VSQTNTLTGCEGARSEIIVIVNTRPVAPLVNNINYCQNETAPLSVTPSPNCSLNWYSLPTGGTSTQTSPTPSTSTVGLTSYYVSQTIATTGCEGPRSEIIVTVNPRPTAPVALIVITVKMKSHYSICNSISKLHWYTTPTEGTQTQQTSRLYNSWTHILLCKSDNDHHRMRGTSNWNYYNHYPIPLVRNITITQCDTDLISDGRTILI
jgi:hypothetical protein